MHKLKLKTSSLDCCNILIGVDLLDNAGELIKEAANSGRVVIITDSNVGPLYGERLSNSLSRARIKAELITVPAGEEHKALKTASDIYNTLASLNIDRGNPVIALGGGMIGDLAGFVAATYMRGIPLVQMPTSLVAQVDSSIGGKVAVNHGVLKNQIGSFYQPCLVLSDVNLLTSLPDDEFANGLAEVIKSAVIFDEKFFNLLESKIERVILKDKGLLKNVIYRSARVKTRVVEKDEKDQGLRQILNFGHTIGHGIEACSNFSISHGRAIAIGMVLAARISYMMEILDKEGYDRLKNLVNRAGLPVNMPKMDTEAIIQAIRHDKKIKNGKMGFVMITNPGAAVISNDVTLEIIKEVILPG